jgi:hypothetical protein
MLLLASAAAATADEGMWLLNRPPLAALKERYGFAPAPGWLEHVQKSAARVGGASGSFVSADGLVITNHHVGRSAVQKLSTSEHNYLRDGFLAPSRAGELKCHDLTISVLMAIEEVTERVNAAVKPGVAAAEAFAARRAATAAIEKEALERTGLRGEVVTLYQGAQFHLYLYKRYTDVRLVFAPEHQAAFFGGDPDNFEFPRFDLDITFFRVYENGQPAKTEHYLKWNRTGLADGELVFVVGHPAATERLITVAELEYQRDVRMPRALASLKTREVDLKAWSQRSAENARRAQPELLGLQNSRKANDGRLAGLYDGELFAAKRRDEAALRKFAQDHPEFDAAGAWDRIAAAQRAVAEHSLRAGAFDRGAMTSTLLRHARTLYRAPREFAKPNGERLREFRETGRPELERRLFSAEPVYDDLEQVRLTGVFTAMAQELGVNDPVVVAVLGGKTPAVRAAELVSGTRVKDVAYRRALFAKSAAELEQVGDPMIALARVLDPEARARQKVVEEQSEIKTQAHAKIARARFAMRGETMAPDATGTLRLSFGAVKGYAEGGRPVPAFTTIAGLFQRAAEQGGREPFDLPASWEKARARLDGATPFNFVSTCDIIGGNSGSPTLNRAGEFVGIIFDGNIQSLVLDYAFSETQARAVSVDARAIVEALRKVYRADALVAELLAGKG